MIKPQYVRVMQKSQSNDDRHFKYYFCGGNLCWDSSANGDDVCSDMDDESIVEFYHCMTCGRSYEISEPCKEERELNYKDYWL